MTDPHQDIERLRDDLAAYSLGALPEREAAALARHLEGCEACRDRLEWLRPAVDQLPAAVEQRTPPERLRESLMTAVRADAAETAAVAAERDREPRRPWWDGLRTAMLRPATGLAVAVVLVVGVAAGYALRGGDESELVTAQAVSAAAPTAAATLERHGDSATLHVSELPPIGRDEVYEVWVQRDGALEPSSTFVLEGDGTASAAVPGSLDDAEAVLVTAEPRPGSEQPTTEPLLQATL
jgi:anti-sigma-K factor RskA